MADFMWRPETPEDIQAAKDFYETRPTIEDLIQRQNARATQHARSVRPPRARGVVRLRPSDPVIDGVIMRLEILLARPGATLTEDQRRRLAKITHPADGVRHAV